MSIIQLLVVLVVLGLALWALEQLPIDATIRQIIRVVVIVLIILWLLSVFFGLAGLGRFRVW